MCLFVCVCVCVFVFFCSLFLKMKLKPKAISMANLKNILGKTVIIPMLHATNYTVNGNQGSIRYVAKFVNDSAILYMLSLDQELIYSTAKCAPVCQL